MRVARTARRTDGDGTSRFESVEIHVDCENVSVNAMRDLRQPTTRVHHSSTSNRWPLDVLE